MAKTLSVGGEFSMSFDEVFKLYYPRLCDFASRLLNNDLEGVEDVVQDAFIIYHQHVKEVSNNAVAIKNYLYTTVKNACLKIHRHNKIIQKYHDAVKLEALSEEYLLDALIHAEIVGEVLKTLKSLPDGCAEVFKMGYFDDLSNQEIADKLKISIHTVKSQKRRALDLLKTKLKPEVLAFFLPFLLR